MRNMHGHHISSTLRLLLLYTPLFSCVPRATLRSLHGDAAAIICAAPAHHSPNSHSRHRRIPKWRCAYTSIGFCGSIFGMEPWILCAPLFVLSTPRIHQQITPPWRMAQSGVCCAPVKTRSARAALISSICAKNSISAGISSGARGNFGFFLPRALADEGFAHGAEMAPCANIVKQKARRNVTNINGKRHGAVSHSAVVARGRMPRALPRVKHHW